MCELIFSAQEFLKLVPGIAIFPISFYLAWKKIGSSVSCSMSYCSNRFSADQISNIVLTNNKDKPLTIFEIHAVISKDISFCVDKFDPPLILKSLETVAITAKPYSELYIGDEPWEPTVSLKEKVELYLSVPGKVIKCKNAPHPGHEAFLKLGHFTQAAKIVKRFNGLTYSIRKAAYAVSYKANGITKTALIDRAGVVGGEWEYYKNYVEPEFMRSTSDITRWLSICKADQVYEIFSVNRLE